MMELSEAIKHCDEKAKELREKTLDMIANGENPKERADCLECAEEHEQLAEWLKHYQAIRQIIHEYGCDYAPVNPDRKPKHTEGEYFNMILDTFNK